MRLLAETHFFCYRVIKISVAFAADIPIGCVKENILYICFPIKIIYIITYKSDIICHSKKIIYKTQKFSYK